MKAYRLLILNKQGVLHNDQKSFSDNVFQAYQLLEKEHGSCGIKGFDLSKIARMLCIEYPQPVTQGILQLLDKREDENCDFEEFLSAVRTILLYDSFFEEMESIFRHIDHAKTGKIRMSDLSEALTKLRSSEVQSLHELRVPEARDVEQSYKRQQNMGNIETTNQMTQAEFLHVMFRTTLDSDN
jgi:Ca2+-binding EF-hand superfamily protein